MAGPAALGELIARDGTDPDASTELPQPGRDGHDVRVELVTSLRPGDDAALRTLLRRAVIPGAVRVAFTREPSYAQGDGVAGSRDHLVVARGNGAIVGMGRASVHTLYRNGEPQRVAYLGELRLAEGARRGTRVLRDGYRLLADALVAGGCDAAFTSITTDNHRARQVLEHGGRLGLPAYTPVASLVTLVAPVPSARPHRRPEPAQDPAQDPAPAMHALAEFLDRDARRRHLALCWREAQFAALAGHGACAADFVLVARGGDLVAAAAVWDQRAYRQVVIDGYEGALRWSRPLASLVLQLSGQPALPAPGAVLAQGALLGASVQAPGDWHALWPRVSAAAARRGLSWLTIARDARDPELPVLRSLLRGARAYRTTLYDVALPGARRGCAWDERLVRPEVGLL